MLSIHMKLCRGHNGVTSVIGAVGGNDFKRLQLGINRPASRDPDDVARYVLSNFNKTEREELNAMFAKAEQLLVK